MPFSTACHTPLSNFEASQNYKEVQDPASEYRHRCDLPSTFVYHLTSSLPPFLHPFIDPPVLSSSFPLVIINFPLDDDPSTSMIAWTTTPWTLPSNLALCVHPDFTYVKVKGRWTTSPWILLIPILSLMGHISVCSVLYFHVAVPDRNWIWLC